MNERSSHLKRILQRALEKPEEERAAYLEVACGDDAELLGKAVALIASDSEAVEPTVRDEPERVDTVIGPYRLLERLGEGAMGEVWRVEQREPIKRIVALKIIKRGMDTRELITRFEIERQAMALMDHPWIAKVYDAGQTQTGRPYIAMEYVAGEKLTDYCARNKLSIVDRLGLFQKVCQAVQHAHQKAVIHRDLKPNNILVVEVDGEPVPKVIDFGIAKATAQRLTDRSAATLVGQLIGTPVYMSPEQVEMSAAGVDTRADVYSLGVILYELMSGTLPHDPQKLAEAGLDQVLRVLREEDPQRPSTRVSTLGDRTAEIAAQRRLDPKKLVGALRGDLDWITLKALEKDRRRRYESPRDLARDIERHLKLEAVEARPPSLRYRMNRFARRKKASVAVVSTLSLAIVAVAVVSVIQSRRVAVQRDRAVHATRRAEAAHLYTLGVNEDIPSRALAYSIASLELADQKHVRQLALKSLQTGATFHHFYRITDAHNPIAVDFSPDGRWLAVGWAAGGNLRLFPVAGGEPIVLRGHEDSIWGLHFTPDSKRLISCGSDMTFRLWSVPNGALLHSIESPDGTWTAFQLLDDGHTVILSDSDDAAALSWRAWDLVTNEVRPLGRWESNDPDGEWGLHAVDPRGRWVVRGHGREVRLVPLDDLEGEAWIRLGTHESKVGGSAFSPRGDRLVTGDIEGNVRLWQTDSTEQRLLHSYDTAGDIAALGFDRSGRHISVGLFSDQGGGVLLFDRESPVGAEPLFLRNIDQQWGFQTALHPKLPWLAMTSTFGMVGAWQLDEQRCIVLRPERTPGHLAFTPDGRNLVVDARGCILVWPLENEPESDPHCVFDLPGASATTLGVHPGGEWVFASFGNGATGDGTIVLVSLDTGSTRTFRPFDFVGALYLDPSGRYMAALGNWLRGDSTRVWDLESDGTLNIDVPGADFNAPMGFTFDSKLLVYFDETLALADPATGSWQTFKEDVRQGFVLSDGYSLVWTDTDGNQWLEDLSSGIKQLLPVASRERVCWDVDVEHRRVVAGYADGTIEVVSFDGTERHLLLGHEECVNEVTFDPLGRWIASSSSDGTIRLWPIPTGTPLQDLPFDRLLDGLKSRTTMRAVPDSTSVDGYSITNVPFAGWTNQRAW